MTQPVEKISVGAGLVLSRYRGERIMITAHPAATDEEILGALRNEGIVVTLVDITDIRHPNYKEPRRVARLGIRASNSLAIAREEIINRQKPALGDADGNLSAQGSPQKAG